jgi:uroporphyrinogen-III synthase
MASLGPLSGLLVGVTAHRRAHDQGVLLGRVGARVLQGPTVRAVPIDHRDPDLVDATRSVVEEPPDVLVVTTDHALSAWLAAAGALGLGDRLRCSLAGVEVMARGPKAPTAALGAELAVAWRPRTERGGEIVDQLVARDPRPRRVAVLRAGGARPVLAERLAEAGVAVLDVATYRWALPEDLGPARRLTDAVVDRRIDAVTFTSSAAVDHLLALAATDGRRDAVVEALDHDRLVVACVGASSAAAVRGAGIERVVVPDRARLGAMVGALGAACSERRRALDVGGREGVLQGTRLILGGEVLDLSERERAVVEVLAERPGAVVPKAELLARCWGTTDADPHVVEVTVARLRRRLGSPDAILTVRRRGYRLAT